MLVILLLSIFILLFITPKLYNLSVLGNPVCSELESKGYIETEADTAGHISCAEGYIEGEDACNFLQKLFINKSNCNYWDKYNFDCNNNLNQEELLTFGTYCVWGSFGWMMLVAMVGSIVVSISLIFILIGVGLTKEND